MATTTKIIALLFLQPRHQMEMGGQRHAPAGLLRERHDKYCTGGRVDLVAGTDGCGKRAGWILKNICYIFNDYRYMLY